MMNNFGNKNSRGGTVNKVLAIFIIVAVFHMVLILIIAWFSGWRLIRTTDGKTEERETAHGKNHFNVEEGKVSGPGEVGKLVPERENIAQDKEISAVEKSSDDDAVPGILDEIAQPTEDLHPGKSIENFETYTVVTGDSFSKIARKTGSSIENLRNANHIEGDIIKVGQILIIPMESEDAKIPLPVPSDLPEGEDLESHGSLAGSSTPRTGYKIYRVENGDTLSKIARLFSTTTDELVNINSLKDPSKLKAGMEVKVPVK